MILRTKSGYDFFECSSAMQKAIRRADVRVAGFFALELWSSGYRDYVWKRLFTISAEDCYGLITAEIEALWQGHELVNKGAKEPKEGSAVAMRLPQVPRRRPPAKLHLRPSRRGRGAVDR